ncbi:hypothetical protein SPHV1_780003 [Novosphingobium sp. KN65.2]|nr:hypothetical protein SPHV1_780003 [Novosphingobium sp. KN65.2]
MGRNAGEVGGLSVKGSDQVSGIGFILMTIGQGWLALLSDFGIVIEICIQAGNGKLGGVSRLISANSNWNTDIVFQEMQLANFT